jgi:hypothetical protein
MPKATVELALTKNRKLLLASVCVPWMANINKISLWTEKEHKEIVQRVKVSYSWGRAQRVSKWQGGLPWGMHWSKPNGKGLNWRTETGYEA